MYFYHAHAVAFGGTVERPAPQTIAALGACSLPISGGTGSANEGKFDNGLVAFTSAQSVVTGCEESRSGATVYVTGTSVAVRGLNIRNMFVADQVVMRIACEHAQPPDPPAGKPAPGWGEPSIITTGCHFDNLRIAGYPVSIDTDHKIFSDYPTHDLLQTAWKNDKARVVNRLMGSALNPPPGPNDPAHLREVYRGFDEQRNATALKPTVLFSFVNDVKGLNGSEIDNWKSIIRIPQFGTIYLGEVIVSPGHRRVTMFRLQLGSPDGGGFSGPSGSSNGGGYP